MPVPTIADPPQPQSGKPQGQPSQKSMTKAERRELQERQRAAKAALKGQPQQQGKKEPSQGKQQPPASGTLGGQAKFKPLPTPQKKAFGGDIQGAKQASTSKDAGIGAAVEDPIAKQVSHGLRIFSHFGQPKPVGHTVKGDIHPAIIRLALLFSEFKISGANARCIAMLTAFKQVRLTIIVIHSYPH